MLDKKLSELAHIIWNADTEYDAKQILITQGKSLFKEFSKELIGEDEPSARPSMFDDFNRRYAQNTLRAEMRTKLEDLTK